MIDIQKDKEIIESATDGPWELSHTSQGDWIDSAATGSPVCMINGYEIDEDQERFDANYISNFDPIKMREYIAIAEREAKQAERVEELEDMLAGIEIKTEDAGLALAIHKLLSQSNPIDELVGDDPHLQTR